MLRHVSRGLILKVTRINRTTIAAAGLLCDRGFKDSTKSRRGISTTTNAIEMSDPTSQNNDEAAAAGEDKKLEPLSPADRKLYGRMGEHMDLFHENFRRTWTTLHTACTTNRRPQNMSMKQFLRLGEDFVRYLTLHHNIEEREIFPILARKMEVFARGGEMKGQHVGIHEGLERFEAYLGEVGRGERELRLGEMGEVMDSFGEVLWKHLDEEVRTLGADNMRLFWTREEMRRMPMG